MGSTTGATSATITQRALALGFAAAGKTYDGNTAATVAVTDNRVAGDVLTATASGAFADKNAGANKVVTVQNASLSGTDAANYVLGSTTGATTPPLPNANWHWALRPPARPTTAIPPPRSP